MKNPDTSLIIELYDLKVSPESKKQFGRVVTTKTLSEEDIIRRITERGSIGESAELRVYIGNKQLLSNICLYLSTISKTHH